MKFFFDGNLYSSVFSKNAIKKPQLAKKWLATWRDINGDIHHDLKPAITTNNQAEYAAVLMVLRHLRFTPVPWLHDADVYGDSQLVIYQLTGQYRVKEEDLKPFWLEALNHIHSIRTELGISIKFEWIPRELNNEALGISRRITMTGPGLEGGCLIVPDAKSS